MKLITIVIIIFIGNSIVTASNPSWPYAYSAGTIGWEEGRSVAFDSNGNYYLLGQVRTNSSNIDANIDFGNGVNFTVDDLTYDCFFVKFDSNNQAQWVKNIPTSGGTGVIDIVIDNSDNIYILGTFQFIAIFDNTTLTGLGLSTFLAKYSPSGNFQWVTNTISPTNARCVGKDLETDGTDIYLTGYFSETQNFGNSTITSSGDNDTFLAKVSNSGNVLFFKQEGGSEAVWGEALAHDGTNLYLTGWYRGTVSIAGSSLTSNGSADYYLAKYNSDGTPVWVEDAGSSSLSDFGKGVIVDENTGDIYVSGRFGGTMELDGITLTSTTGYDLFFAKYNSSGVVQWAKQSTGSGTTVSGNLIFDGLGEIVVYGANNGEMTIEETTINSASWFKYLARFDLLGNLICLEQLEEPGSIEETEDKINSDGSGTIYKTGAFSGTISFGDQTLTSIGSNDIYLAKQSSASLPVELVSFQAVIEKPNIAYILWETQSEINTSHFSIERKLANQDWESIGELKARGAPDIPFSYHFEDKNLKGNTIYYRLKIFDLDESFEYSPIIAIEFFPTIESISIFPNPVKNKLSIKGLDDQESYMITICDSWGKEMSKIHIDGFNPKIDISRLQDGIYFIRCESLLINKAVYAPFLKN